MQIINIDDKEYPSELRKEKYPPEKIYCEGNTNLLNSLCFSIVGSRDLTNYGKRIEQKFVKDLALRGITIVSGMAVGADTVAHKETLNYGGKTIAVLPCGFHQIYPECNESLYHEIIEKDGLVISEYPPDQEVCSSFFLKRNRIVAGISKGLLVVEAKYRSGTSVTAKFAKEQGKPVFAFPGRLDSKNGVGVNRLIQEGALMVVSANDIIHKIPEFQELTKEIPKRNSFVKKEYRKIYSILNDEPIPLDEICRKTNNSIPATLNLLSLMELEDLIEEIVGVGYVRKYQEEK